MKRMLLGLAVFGLGLVLHGMALAATATGTMTVSATLTSACSVSNSAMTFPSTAPIAGASDQIANTGVTLTVACTTGTSPTIWSDTARVLSDGGGTPITFAFNLSQTSGAAADDLPITTGTAAAITGYTADGTAIVVPLYGKILAANFIGKPANTYTKAITVSVNY